MEIVKAGDMVSPQTLPAVQQRNRQLGEAFESKAPEVSFADTMDQFMKGVNTMQLDAKTQQEKFITGEPVDLHDVMIAAEKAKTSFSLLLELRNKTLDMYREVIRIQV